MKLTISKAFLMFLNAGRLEINKKMSSATFVNVVNDDTIVLNSVETLFRHLNIISPSDCQYELSCCNFSQLI